MSGGWGAGVENGRKCSADRRLPQFGAQGRGQVPGGAWLGRAEGMRSGPGVRAAARFRGAGNRCRSPPKPGNLPETELRCAKKDVTSEGERPSSLA